MFHCGCNKVEPYKRQNALSKHIKIKHLGVPPLGTTKKRKRGRPSSKNEDLKY